MVKKQTIDGVSVNVTIDLIQQITPGVSIRFYIVEGLIIEIGKDEPSGNWTRIT